MPLPKIQRKNTDPMIHNVFHKYFMNAFAILKPVWQKKKKENIVTYSSTRLSAHHWGVGVTCHFWFTLLRGTGSVQGNRG